MLFEGDLHTALALCIHMLLSTSSLIFKIPLRRIKDGSRLWPEARWHAILFATRHLISMALTWYEQWSGIEQPLYYMNVAIVFANIAAADIVNYVYRDTHSNYVRDMQTNPWLKYLFSHVQIGGTVYCLIGQRRYSFHFLAVFVIQFSAFMMTLRRKNVISHSTWVGIYGSILLFGSGVAYNDLVRHSLWIMIALSNLSTVLRCVVGLNKYLLWTIMTLLVFWHRDVAKLLEQRAHVWPTLIAASYVVWIGGGVCYAMQRRVRTERPLQPSTT